MFEFKTSRMTLRPVTRLSALLGGMLTLSFALVLCFSTGLPALAEDQPATLRPAQPISDSDSIQPQETGQPELMNDPSVITPDSQFFTPVSDLEKPDYDTSLRKKMQQRNTDQPSAILGPEVTQGSQEQQPPDMTTVETLQERHTRPVSFSKRRIDPDAKILDFSPAPAIAIFAVITHDHEKAFGDVSQMVAREFALQMEEKAPGTRVLNPVYTVDEIRMRGLGHVYDKVMAAYIRTGRPEATALDYLLRQLSTDGRAVTRVMFVETNLNMGKPVEPTGFVNRFKAFMTDALPKHMHYFVESRVQVFDTEQPDMPMVWAQERSKPINVNEIVNFTPSVYHDSDSRYAFAQASRQLSRGFTRSMPKNAYMLPEYDHSVQGNVVSSPQKSSHKIPLSESTRDALERILHPRQ